MHLNLGSDTHDRAGVDPSPVPMGEESRDRRVKSARSIGSEHERIHSLLLRSHSPALTPVSTLGGCLRGLGWRQLWRPSLGYKI